MKQVFWPAVPEASVCWLRTLVWGSQELAERGPRLRSSSPVLQGQREPFITPRLGDQLPRSSYLLKRCSAQARRALLVNKENQFSKPRCFCVYEINQLLFSVRQWRSRWEGRSLLSSAVPGPHTWPSFLAALLGPLWDSLWLGPPGVGPTVLHGRTVLLFFSAKWLAMKELCLGRNLFKSKLWRVTDEKCHFRKLCCNLLKAALLLTARHPCPHVPEWTRWKGWVPVWMHFVVTSRRGPFPFVRALWFKVPSAAEHSLHVALPQLVFIWICLTA